MLGTGSLSASGGGHGGGGHGGGGHGGGGHFGGGGHISGGGHSGGGGHVSGGAVHFGGDHFSGGHSVGVHSVSPSHLSGGGHGAVFHSVSPVSRGSSHSTASGFAAHGALVHHEFGHRVFDHHSGIGHHYGFGFLPAYRSYNPVRYYRAVPDYCDPRSPDYDPDYCYYLRYGVFPSAASSGRSSSAPGRNGRAVVLAVDERPAVVGPAAAAPGRRGSTEEADRDGVREGMGVELPLISATEAPEALPMERRGHP